MKRTNFQRVMALLICLTFVIGSFAVTATAAQSSNDSSDNASSGSSGDIYDSSSILELLDLISYQDYILNNVDVEAGKNTIVIKTDSEDVIVKDKTNASYVIGEYGEEGNPILSTLTPGTGTVSWTVPEGCERGKYNITLKPYTKSKKIYHLLNKT